MEKRHLYSIAWKLLSVVVFSFFVAIIKSEGGLLGILEDRFWFKVPDIIVFRTWSVSFGLACTYPLIRLFFPHKEKVTRSRNAVFALLFILGIVFILAGTLPAPQS